MGIFEDFERFCNEEQNRVEVPTVNVYDPDYIKLRCTLVYTYVVEKLIELNCPGDVAIQIIPPAQEIEHRLMLDAVNCD